MPTDSMKVARSEFSPAPETAGEARAFVRETLRDWGVKRESDDIILLASELVTNAVIHAETTLEVTLRRLPGAVEVVVADRVPDLAVPKAGPLKVDTSPSTENTRSGGLGLALAGAIATSWGVSYSKDDKAVWFRVDDEDAEESGVRSDAGPQAGAARTSLVPPLPVRPGRRRPARPNPWAQLDAALGARLSLADLLDRTVDFARTALGGDAAYIALATTDETEWEVRSATGLSTGVWRPFLSRTEETFPSAAPEPGPVINDDLMLARAHRGRLSNAGMRSLVTAPLMVEGRITGLVGVASRRARHFGTTAARRLQDGADRIALPVERARLAQVELARRASLSFLAEASDLLAGTLDEQMTAALAAQLTASRLGTWCVVHTVNDLGATRIAHATHRNENYTDVLRGLATALPPPVQREPAPLWTRAALSEAGLHDELTLELAEGPAVSIPLSAHGRELGRMTVGKQPGEDFTRDDFDVAENLAQRVSSAMENARLYSNQTDMSEALQRSLLPAKEKVPRIPEVDHAVFYRPAGERSVVGGDFYDVFAADGRWCFAIGDVCGTGPAAAAVTGLARHTLRALAREGFSPSHIMHRLNLAILDENTTTRFLTMLYGEMTPLSTGGMRIRLVSAGHPLPLRLRGTDDVTPVGSSQPLLGAFEDVDFFTETVEVAPGDVLLAVTDGVTERRNSDDMLGDDGLTKIFEGCSGLTAQAVISRIDRDLEEFAPGGHTDDTAMLVLRFL